MVPDSTTTTKHSTIPVFVWKFSFPFLHCSSKMKCKFSQRVNNTRALFFPDKHSLVLHGCIYFCLWLKKFNAIKIEGVKPSLLVQDTPPKPCGKWKIDRSTVWLMNFCLDMQWSWTFLSAVIMLSSWPTPKENNHLLYLSLTPPMKGKPLSFTELNKI